MSIENKTKYQIISLLIEHSRIIYSVISDMGVFFNGWKEKKDNFDNKKNKMQLNEEDADVIKIRVIKDFSEAGAQGLGDYVALVLRMDNVINTALEFVDLLGFIDEKNIKDGLKQTLYDLINIIIKMTDSLKKTIKCLRDNPDDVLENTTAMHELENQVDGIYRDAINTLYEDESLDIRMLLRLRDILDTLERLADQLHDIGDVIRVVRYS